MCKVVGCERASMYKDQDVCQKHYFRYMRNGSYNLQEKTRKYRVTTPNGYEVIYHPDHNLARSDGYIFEHRFVLYAERGDQITSCDFCGAGWSWRPYYDHVDHIDCDKSNNRIENLRPLCNACNTSRGKGFAYERSNSLAVTISGETMTPSGWAKRPDVSVCGATIRRRIANGATSKEAVYGRKLTHKSKDRPARTKAIPDSRFERD